MGVTRARVYQLLEDCAKVMDVRWPAGEYLLAAVSAKLKLGRQAGGRPETVPGNARSVLPGQSAALGMDGDVHPEAPIPNGVNPPEELSALAERVRSTSKPWTQCGNLSPAKGVVRREAFDRCIQKPFARLKSAPLHDCDSGRATLA